MREGTCPICHTELFHEGVKCWCGTLADLREMRNRYERCVRRLRQIEQYLYATKEGGIEWAVVYGWVREALVEAGEGERP